MPLLTYLDTELPPYGGKQKVIKLWDIWCKAIGTKAYEDNNKADRVAIIRTGWVLLHILTCLAIILNAIANHGTKLFGFG